MTQSPDRACRKHRVYRESAAANRVLSILRHRLRLREEGSLASLVQSRKEFEGAIPPNPTLFLAGKPSANRSDRSNNSAARGADRSPASASSVARGARRSIWYR